MLLNNPFSNCQLILHEKVCLINLKFVNRLKLNYYVEFISKKDKKNSCLNECSFIMSFAIVLNSVTDY